MKYPSMKRMLAAVMASAMMLGSVSLPVFAEEEPEKTPIALDWTVAEDGDFSVFMPMREYTEPVEEAPYADNEMVRVSIFLEQKSTIEAGFSTM
ncbi:MAG: hypothetical protein MJ175_05565, partial [Clostridia bacterium]|nr:hypothetical protein [Clostridia bacterium]